MDEIDLARIRRTYERADLREDTISADPIAQLQRWLHDAQNAGVLEPNAMCVSTVHESLPSSRIVLLRRLDESGLVFYTSYFSRKGQEIAGNPHVAALFYWPLLERQVRVEGRVEQVSEEESDAYFATRPRGNQIGAWASEQSEVVENRDILDQRMRDYTERFEGEDVPRPHSWGGYIIKPARFEYWQGRPNRMHDRLEFSRDGSGWAVRRLQP